MSEQKVVGHDFDMIADKDQCTARLQLARQTQNLVLLIRQLPTPPQPHLTMEKTMAFRGKSLILAATNTTSRSLVQPQAPGLIWITLRRSSIRL